MAGNDRNKRRRIDSEGSCINDIPDVLLAKIIPYLTSPSRLLFAAAMTPASASSLTANTNVILSSTTPWYSRMVVRDRPYDWYKSDEWKEYEKYVALINIQSECNIGGRWSRLDCADFGEAVASKLCDDEIRLILKCIGARDQLYTLRITGCISLNGGGLDILRGSSALRHVDLSLVAHDTACIKPAPALSEDAVLPILDSIIGSDRSSLEFLCFPQKWRSQKRSVFQQFVGRYCDYLAARNLRCNCRAECSKLCQHTDAGVATPKPWVIQNALDFPFMREDLLMKKYGLQRFTCHKCFERVCYDCSHGDGHEIDQHYCVNCEKDYCAQCGACSHYRCWECDDYLCTGCEENGVRLILQDPSISTYDEYSPRLCEDCYAVIKSKTENQQ